MNKNLQSILGISTLVIAGSVAYYLFSYLPAKNKLAQQTSLQKQCLDLGSKREKEDQTYDKQNPSDGSIYTTDFIFDKKTNDCLLRILYSKNGNSQRTVVDLFTNKTLGYYMENKNSDVVDGDRGNYLLVERSHF